MSHHQIPAPACHEYRSGFLARVLGAARREDRAVARALLDLRSYVMAMFGRSVQDSTRSQTLGRSTANNWSHSAPCIAALASCAARCCDKIAIFRPAAAVRID